MPGCWINSGRGEVVRDAMSVVCDNVDGPARGTLSGLSSGGGV